MAQTLEYRLQERIKELRALHRTALLLQDDGQSPALILQTVVDLLPEAMQYPLETSARIVLDGTRWCSTGDRDEGALLAAGFGTQTRRAGRIEIRSWHGEATGWDTLFLDEERELVQSLAQMLGSWAQRREAEAALQDGVAWLEDTVRERTRELQEANARLRGLARELCLTEARERRQIASDLHDELGQTLALLRLKLGQARGNLVFSGLDHELVPLQALVDRAIRTTRHLTTTLSPPVLYELGLAPACDWLAEEFQQRHGLAVSCRTTPVPGVSEEVRVSLFKAAQELLTNCWKHARATHVELSLATHAGNLLLSVRDDGQGFDPDHIQRQDAFGLFSIRTRLRDLGGDLELESRPGHGCLATLRVPLEETPA
ncbi:MAG: hypothetical protein H6678_11760 [Candidatus Delongbacteria bacterium]|nr:hypothetical protein [Candidatus Cloacimonadota bacterium]MCB9474479.1 hypothetical protein [Candidatus Delongbacteria bacterium]